MMSDDKSIWLFHADGARFAGAVFETSDIARKWISMHRLTGLLTEYPINKGVYEWAIGCGIFQPKSDKHFSSEFIGSFTTAGQHHIHFVVGEAEEPSTDPS
ncbi:MAG: hypothetical protein ABL893_21210 [Hyphomicrobium sp.]